MSVVHVVNHNEKMRNDKQYKLLKTKNVRDVIECLCMILVNSLLVLNYFIIQLINYLERNIKLELNIKK